jgi:hypothetical protein
MLKTKLRGMARRLSRNLLKLLLDHASLQQNLKISTSPRKPARSTRGPESRVEAVIHQLGRVKKEQHLKHSMMNRCSLALLRLRRQGRPGGECETGDGILALDLNSECAGEILLGYSRPQVCDGVGCGTVTTSDCVLVLHKCCSRLALLLLIQWRASVL